MRLDAASDEENVSKRVGRGGGGGGERSGQRAREVSAAHDDGRPVDLPLPLLLLTWQQRLLI